MASTGDSTTYPSTQAAIFTFFCECKIIQAAFPSLSFLTDQHWGGGEMEFHLQKIFPVGFQWTN